MVEFEIKIHGIEFGEFLMIRKPNDFPSENEFEFTLRTDTKIWEKKLLQNVEVDILFKPDNIKLVASQIIVGFEITNFDEVIKKNEEGYSLPKNLLVQLRSLAVGIMRGVLHSKLQGSYLSNAYLPIVPGENGFGI
jgi:hypothetical protein